MVFAFIFRIFHSDRTVMRRILFILFAVALGLNANAQTGLNGYTCDNCIPCGEGLGPCCSVWGACNGPGSPYITYEAGNGSDGNPAVNGCDMACTDMVSANNPCGVEGTVVAAQSFSYTPSDLEIQVGQTVVWVNVDGFHDVNGAESTLGDMWNNPESFSFGAVNGAADGVCIGSHTFTVEGTYNYDCSINSHAANGMVATITVVPTPEGCTDELACNFNPFATQEDNSCTFPGCVDSDALNYNADAGCPADCVYLTFDCSSIGNAAWQDLPMGVFPDWQESMIGIEWNGEWVFNIPEMVEEPQSGVDYGVHHVDWISFEGLPNWIEESDFVLGELSQSSQHCITATGIPTEPGVIEVIAIGEVFISLFGEEFSIGEHSFSAILEITDNPNLIPGCMYMTALNYLSYAEIDDGSCLFAGCTDESAVNYSPLATIDDGSCVEPCSPGGDSSCPTDITGDGFVNVSDLLELLSDFGAECIIEVIEFTCGDPMNYHGYDYATVQIGDQCWFAENLRTEHYANGDAIPGELSASEWGSTTQGAMTIYGEGTSTVSNGSSDEVANLADYGRLYNWYAVDDSRGLCPSGWHVPTDEEFMTLEMELGMSESQANGTGWRGTDQGTQMKSSASDSPSWDGTNTSGFSGLAGGYRPLNGGFFDEGNYGYFWSASANGTSAWVRGLNGGSTEVYRGNGNLRSGLSVRCVWD